MRTLPPIHFRSYAGATVAVRAWDGRGPTFVMVHGLGGSLQNWDLIANDLATMGSVVAIDLPGFGHSPPARKTDMTTYRDVVSAVGQTTGTDVVLVGNSMGGLVVEMVAATRPDWLRSLITLAPATLGPIEPRVPDHPAVAARILTQSIPVVGALVGRTLVARTTPEQYVDMVYDQIMAHPERLDPELRRRSIQVAVARRSMPWAVDTYAASARSIRRHLLDRSGFRTMIEAIDVPTLVIHGKADPVVPSAAIDWLMSIRPDWTRHDIDDVGHVPMLEVPAVTTEVVGSFAAAAEATPAG